MHAHSVQVHVILTKRLNAIRMEHDIGSMLLQILSEPFERGLVVNPSLVIHHHDRYKDGSGANDF